jgi:NitT/TauT family transport system permease protein
MPKTLFKNFFGIRIPVSTSEKILLGLTPIFLLLLVWIMMTTGSKETVVIPTGEFEGFEKAPPLAGHVFKKNQRIILKGWKLREEYKNEVDKAFIVKGDREYEITGFGRREFRDKSGVRVVLKPGKIIRKFILNPAQIAEAPLATPPSDLSYNEADDSLMMMEYQYEVVETRIFSPTIIPSPFETLSSLPSLWIDRKLTENILNSFLRVGGGFLVAFIIAFPIALLMGTFSKFEALLAPLMLFGGYLPIPALVPLTMSLFGTSEQQKIMFLALAFGIYLLPLFVQALKEVDNVFLQTGYTLGSTKFQILNKILLPIAMPKIFDAMRLGFGIGWGYIILAEMVDMGSKGVGALILISQRRGPKEDIYLVLIAIVIMAFITDKIWEKVDKELFPYRRKKR